ncbi:hypothetical protein ACH4NV_06275 [Streptomyces althioticus]|uniref:Uncharacterized protein n=3 Tax=Actinomycetes TaxID=1760 RepID=A0A9X5HBI3_9ACTN|nr:hypothetical protein [Streptomyces sp. OS603R]ALV54714.1 hypothetical protein ASR50_32925 [Streptomyces sp. 4F]KEG38253.1 hypothetical protein DJ64_22775 [Streptomyces griseorubens]MBJ6629843.1 hypothetical protein [Streptomyces sp. I4(2020)]MBM4826902.1 hypothetical protein [Actinospica acidiphila]NUV51566.1 hypothetical protein [Streptomyces coelicolor]RMI88594.1 hypothetical protein BIU87_06630 [Streptomyces sp. ZS0098]
MPTRRELGMHEMWCGADTSGEPVWHVLTPDKTSTLCGVDKEEESPRRDTTDRHCFTCMKSFQAVVASR